MQTPTHPLTTYWLLHGRPHALAAAIASVAPDVPYLVALLGGLPSIASAAASGDASSAVSAALWSAFGNPVALFVAQKLLHNLVLASLFAIVALVIGKGMLRAVALGWLLHVTTDLAFHGDDAYPVLWPLSARVFPAPFSPWDPDHFGVLTGVSLALLATTLWLWLARRVRRVAAIACVAMALATLAGAAFRVSTPESRRSESWVDDGVEWTGETAPIAALLAEGRARDALTAVRTTPIASADASLPPWERDRARARQQLLQGYAQDLLGNREQALVSYAIAEKLEPAGGLGHKARRFQAERFTGERGPRVRRGWLVLLAWGLAASALLLRRARTA